MTKATKIYPNPKPMFRFQMAIFIFVSTLALNVLEVWSGGHKSDANVSAVV